MGKSFESHTQGIGSWGEALLKAMGVPIAEAPKAAEETDKLSKSQQKAQGVTATLTSRFGEMGARMAESTQMSEGQAAALEEVTGSAHSTSQEVGLATDAISKLTEADVNAITTLQEHTRAQILANAGYNNAKVATLQYQAALTTMTQSLVDDTDQKNANAQATLALVNSELNAQNAIATVNEEYANSIDRLADLNTVMGNSEAMTKAVATAAKEFAASLKEENIELQGTLQGLQNVENQQQGVANAILGTQVALEESNQKLREAKAVYSDAGAATNVLATAVNETATALLEESIELDAAIQSADSFTQAQIRLANAQKEGTLEIQNYVNGLKETAEKEAAMVAELERSGAAWSDIPPFVEKNIETLKLFGVAAKQGGEAAKEAADMAAEAFNKATSSMQSEMDSLVDIFIEGGKEMDESVDKWFEDIEGKIGRELSKGEKKAVEGIAELASLILTGD